MGYISYVSCDAVLSEILHCPKILMCTICYCCHHHTLRQLLCDCNTVERMESAFMCDIFSEVALLSCKPHPPGNYHTATIVLFRMCMITMLSWVHFWGSDAQCPLPHPQHWDLCKIVSIEEAIPPEIFKLLWIYLFPTSSVHSSCLQTLMWYMVCLNCPCTSLNQSQHTM